jgi:hypothetical protein
MSTAHAGILSKDVEFYLDNTKVENLQEFPNLGAAAEQVETTTLADANRTYINGIKDFGTLDFTFLYDNSGSTSNYRVLRAAEEDGLSHDCKVEFPDGTSFSFSGQISVAVQGAGVNAALQFIATVNLGSDITVVNPQ